MVFPLHSEEEQNVHCDLRWSKQALSFTQNRRLQNKNMPRLTNPPKICPEIGMPGNFAPKYAAPHLSSVSLCMFPKNPPHRPLSQSRYIFLAFFQLCQNDSVFDLNKCEKFKSERSKPWFGAAEDVKPSGSSRSPTYIRAFAQKGQRGTKFAKVKSQFFSATP